MESLIEQVKALKKQVEDELNVNLLQRLTSEDPNEFESALADAGVDAVEASRWGVQMRRR